MKVSALKYIVLFVLIYLYPSDRQLMCQNNNIDLYLEDTSYYYCRGVLDFWEFKTKEDSNSARQYLRSTGVYHFFKDSLSDGCYKLYNLEKRDSSKKDKESSLVAKGCFVNQKRQGVFKYLDIDNVTPSIKIVPFKDGVAHGKVIEFENNEILYISEYKNGIKHGFFLIRNKGFPFIRISYYENGEIIHTDTFEYY